ncbi:MAG: metal ABC transporter permease [Candidatus Micrarchaeia archaeon]
MPKEQNPSCMIVSYMLEFLEYGFMQRAFISGILIAMVCSIIGLYLVLRRMALIGDGLAHISFGGIAAGMFFGIYPLISALIFSILSVIGIQKLKKMKVYGDAAIAIMFSFGLSLGVILLSYSGGFNADLFSYLFGSILSVSQNDLYLISILAIGVLSFVFLFYKELFYITFDEEGAKVSGINVERFNTALLILCAIAIVISLRVVGVLLVASFIAIPASTALLFRSSFKNSIIFSAVIAISSIIIGLSASYYLDLAAGGAVVFTLVLVFALSLIYKNLLKK